MKSLVTGAAGFIGRNVVQQLLAQGEPVRALVRKEDQAAPLRAMGVEVVVGDVRDPAVVEQAVKDIDVVLHCAAAVGHHFSAQEMSDTNVGGVRNLLEAMRKTGSGRLVLLSTINVLGNRSFYNANEEVSCRRSGEPSSDVKIEAEKLALDYHRRHAVDVVVFRPPLVYGPGEKNVPRIIDAIRRGKFLFIGSRDNLIPMIHVSDLVQAMLLAARAPDPKGRIYHISDGEETTIGQFADQLAALSGSSAPTKVLPAIVPRVACRVFEMLGRLGLRKKPAPINRVSLRFLGTSRHVDISRARNELGYSPHVACREGLAATVSWIEQQARDESKVAESAA